MFTFSVFEYKNPNFLQKFEFRCERFFLRKLITSRTSTVRATESNYLCFLFSLTLSTHEIHGSFFRNNPSLSLRTALPSSKICLDALCIFCLRAHQKFRFRSLCWFYVINNFIISSFVRFSANATIKQEKWNGGSCYIFFSFSLLFKLSRRIINL